MRSLCHSGDDRHRHKSVRAHKWVWARKSGESLWTHNAPPELAVRKSRGEWNEWYLLLTQLFWFLIRGHKIRKIRKISSTKGTTYFTRLWFFVPRAREERCGFRGILLISEPTLTCGLRRIFSQVDRPHCVIQNLCDDECHKVMSEKCPKVIIGWLRSVTSSPATALHVCVWHDSLYVTVCYHALCVCACHDSCRYVPRLVT